MAQTKAPGDFGEGEGSAKKGWAHFYWGSWSLKTPRKDFDLAIAGGLGWIKLLKMGQGKVYISCKNKTTKKHVK